MDGVFMKKIIKFTICVVLIALVLEFAGLWQDRQTLKDELIRLHVVGASDSEEDQRVKLQVKDAIVDYLQPIMEKLPTKEQAMNYIRRNLSVLQELSNQVLDRLGIKDRANVTLKPERFERRVYDTFMLPAGVYDSLRITIGTGEGKNWWCVAFPTLCLPATADGFEDVAVSTGFSKNLTGALTGKRAYRIRFFFLDCIGKLENLFC